MAHLKSKIFGHETILQQLQLLGETQRLPSCLIFSGPIGVGKRKVAKALAQGALCEHSSLTNWQACGQCGSCHRIYKDQSESIKEISPQQQQIRIDEAES
jgi:DNA polymerase III subunit delta'